MRFLKGLIFITIPVLIVANLYYFSVAKGANVDFKYVGFEYIWQNVETFNGLTFTVDSLNQVKDSIHNFAYSSTHVTDWETFWTNIGNFFDVFFKLSTIGFSLIGDVVLDVVWVLGLLTGGNF